MKKKYLLFVLLLSFFSSISFANNGPGDKKKYYNVGNWENNMSHGCVILNEDNDLIINLKLYFAVDDLTPFAPIYYTTKFNGVASGLEGPINNASLDHELTDDGQLVYSFSKEVFYQSYLDECTADPTFMIPFEYNITLKDEFGDLYPVEENLGLFAPPVQHSQIANNYVNGYYIPEVVYEGVKDICCYVGITHSSGGRSFQSTKDQNQADQTMDLSIYPNPFKEILNLNFKTTQPSDIKIHLWDIRGQLVYQTEFYASSEGIQTFRIATNSLPVGIYSCQIISNSASTISSVVKTSR